MQTTKIQTLQEALDLISLNQLKGKFIIPEKIYHDHKLGALNNSAFAYLDKSPAHYKAWTEEPNEPTPAMILGTMVHEAILQPDVYAKKYILEPEGINKRTNAGKEEYAKFLQDNLNNVVITKEQKELVEEIAKSVKSHPYFENLLTGGEPEQTFIWNDKDTGSLCKCRTDYINHKLKLIIDLKTTIDASEFGKSAANFNYHTQNAFYQDGVKEIIGEDYSFIFFVVEKSKPYGLRLCKLDAESVDLGRQKYKRLMKIYADCLQTKSWHGYTPDIETVSLPRWAFTN